MWPLDSKIDDISIRKQRITFTLPKKIKNIAMTKHLEITIKLANTAPAPPKKKISLYLPNHNNLKEKTEIKVPTVRPCNH